MPTQSRSGSAQDTVATLVALHFLGGSAEQWTPLFDKLAGRCRCAAIDLPGFGSAAQTPGYDVAAMAAHVADAIRRLAPQRWLLVGHSMGAKVACAVARMAEDGTNGLDGLMQLVLIAGSPPRPEPMKESKRQTMRNWFAGSEAERRRQADGYIRDNVAGDLPADRHADLVDGVLAANRNAWLAWLDNGSREDWAEQIGVLHTPTLILAGAKDAALGVEAQQAAMGPHFASARWHVVPDAAHLVPVEQPDAVAACIRVVVGGPKLPEPEIAPAYRALIDSHRVSARTRQVLLERAEPVTGDRDVLSSDEVTILAALTDRLIPQGGEQQIDISTRLIQSSTSEGDGWRFAELAPDRTALRAGLHNLDAIAQSLEVAGFAFLSGEQRDALLTALADARLTSPLLPEAGGLTARQLQLWFEDMRAFAIQVYVSHPATAARIGFSGIANRGDMSGPQGFQHVGLGRREPWEPVGLAGIEP